MIVKPNTIMVWPYRSVLSKLNVEILTLEVTVRLGGGTFGRQDMGVKTVKETSAPLKKGVESTVDLKHAGHRVTVPSMRKGVH